MIPSLAQIGTDVRTIPVKEQNLKREINDLEVEFQTFMRQNESKLSKYTLNFAYLQANQFPFGADYLGVLNLKNMLSPLGYIGLNPYENAVIESPYLLQPNAILILLKPNVPINSGPPFKGTKSDDETKDETHKLKREIVDAFWVYVPPNIPDGYVVLRAESRFELLRTDRQNYVLKHLPNDFKFRATRKFERSPTGWIYENLDGFQSRYEHLQQLRDELKNERLERLRKKNPESTMEDIEYMLTQ